MGALSNSNWAFADANTLILIVICGPLLIGETGLAPFAGLEMNRAPERQLDKRAGFGIAGGSLFADPGAEGAEAAQFDSAALGEMIDDRAKQAIENSPCLLARQMRIFCKKLILKIGLEHRPLPPTADFQGSHADAIPIWAERLSRTGADFTLRRWA